MTPPIRTQADSTAAVMILTSQAVVLGPAIVFRGAPFGLDPTLLFHAVQGGKERAKTHSEGTGSNLCDASGHADSMQWFQCQRFQDQEV
jgi:hypothetical protein